MNQEAALEFLCRVASGIASVFGENCETIVHEIDGQKITNLALYNGHVSSRKAGSTLSIYGNDTVTDSQGNTKLNLDADYLNQLVTIKRNKHIKSSTFHLKGDDFHYALGINIDITLLEKMERLFGQITVSQGQLMTSLSNAFQPNMEDLFDNCLEIIGQPVEQLKKSDRLVLVNLLIDKGFFQIQKSVPYAAERLGVSKYTIYNYINELEAK